MKKVYLDNAATTYPKPSSVVDSMVDFMTNSGANPGRGGYELSLQSGRLVLETRRLINSLFKGPGPDNVVFTQNITASLNMAMRGMFKKGWHIITTSMEHNSVIRPLRSLEDMGLISLSIVNCKADGTLDVKDIEEAIIKDTKAVVMTHASNLTGTILPIEEVGHICTKYDLYFIVDSAQTAGTIDIDMKKCNIDILAFTGHKGLLGPQGTGGFIINERANETTSPIFSGGTGSRSHIDTQPDFLPDKFESGTLNTAGIAGLKAGIEFIFNIGMDNIRKHENMLLKALYEGLSEIEGMCIYGPMDYNKQTNTLAVNIKDMDPSDIAFNLDNKYGIMVRSGLHCTPYGHRTIGTYPLGSVRFSIGYFNTMEDIGYTVNAMKEIEKER
ncbi:putative cysteine desulfurase [Oxobacter pfennigii]|uniref:cysteine desulfurase n=1 Tax=Oxobacter pfennigii TaxID=36849 RepID=A0A0P8WC04_9CLOT|nr:aminotransferase class V-fold PLP-dependent enzyme [Oxobacter pfennigii]KPU46255.1 putative cysteine desulfurase [Oxobacter pfennigii]